MQNSLTYLTGFHENRKICIVLDKNPQLLLIELFHENFPKFLLNCKIYENIRKEYVELKNELQKIKTDLREEFEFFNVKNIEDIF